MKRKSVYVLTAIHYKVHNDGRRGHYVKGENDSVECWTDRIGVFNGVKQAENVISILVRQEKDAITRWGGWTGFFGFVLDEHYLNDALFAFGPRQNDSYMNISHFESRRTYLSDGTLNCFSDIDDRCSKKFTGRKDGVTNVKSGDIAIKWEDDELVPILIDKVAFTSEEWRKKFAPGVSGDVTDDSGIAFTAGCGHCHPFSPNVFPVSCLPYYKISAKTVKALNAAKNNYYDGED